MSASNSRASSPAPTNPPSGNTRGAASRAQPGAAAAGAPPVSPNGAGSGSGVQPMSIVAAPAAGAGAAGNSSAGVDVAALLAQIAALQAQVQGVQQQPSPQSSASAFSAAPVAVADIAADAASSHSKTGAAGASAADSQAADRLQAVKDLVAQQQKDLAAITSWAMAPPTASTSAAFKANPALTDSIDTATLLRTLMNSQNDNAELARKQNAASAASLLLLQSLGDLPAFDGRCTPDTTLIANEWLQNADNYFASRERALGLTAAQGDESRLLSAINALKLEARK